MSLAAKTEKARKKAIATNNRVFVIEYDHEEGREYTICDPSYLDTDEFYAFAGYLMAICYPDGTVERWENNPRELVRN